MQSNAGKFKDSTPEISPAGKLFDQGGSASECIHGRGPEVNYFSKKIYLLMFTL